MAPQVVDYSMESLKPVSRISVVFIILQFIYGIPSLAVMIIFLIKLRKYENSFYRVVQIQLLTNILCNINSWLALRIFAYRTGIDFLIILDNIIPGIVDTLSFLINFFFHLQFCSTVTLNIHRITSIAFPFGYDRFWSKCYFLPFVFGMIYSLIPQLLIHGKTVSISLVNGTLMGTRYLDIVPRFLYITTVFSAVYFLLLLFSGLITAVLFLKTVKNMNSTARTIGKKLTKIALTYCFIFSGNLFWSVIVTFDTPLKSISSYTMLFSSDLMTLSFPYVLMIFDSNIRRDLFKQSNNQAVPVVVSSTLNA